MPPVLALRSGRVPPRRVPQTLALRRCMWPCAPCGKGSCVTAGNGAAEREAMERW